MDTQTENEELEFVGLINERYQKIHNLFFIQIGSNDGKTGDPIYEYIKKFNWKGILVEPVPYLFDKLKETYKDFEGLIFENAAIDNKDGSREFYQLRRNNDPEIPFWYDQLGSFKKEVVLKHKPMIPGFDNYFVTDEVRCLSFGSLLRKHDVRTIDLLHIDTEGYDFEILKLVPFETMKPTMILYEHQHLCQEDHLQCAAMLEEKGYTLMQLLTDTFAYL